MAPIVPVLRPRAPERAFGASNTSRPRPDGGPATRVACRSIVPMIAVGFLLIVVGFSLIAVRSGDPESRSSRSVSIGRQWSSAYDARSGQGLRPGINAKRAMIPGYSLSIPDEGRGRGTRSSVVGSAGNA